MKVSEQIDRWASAVDRIDTWWLRASWRYPDDALLTLAADFCGVLMGWIATTLAHPVSLRYFLNHGLKECL